MTKRKGEKGRKPLVLVVEDNPGERELFRDFLERSGFEALTASNGEEALAHAAKRSPQAIIMDVNLFGENQGFEVCSLLKSKPRTANIPVIFVTGRNLSDRDKLRGYDCGAVDYLIKPVDLKVLEAKLRSILRYVLKTADGDAVRLAGPRHKILVVDDSELCREMVGRTLRENGYEVISADSGERAMELAASHRPDLILLDLVMPGMNGAKVQTLLSQSETTKSIPVIMMTDMSNDGDVLRDLTIGRGVRDFLPKSAGPLQLLMHVQRLLSDGAKTLPPKTQAEPEGAVSGAMLERGPIRVDVNSRQVWVCGRKIKKLGPKLFDLLVLLFNYRDGVTREKLLKELGGDSQDPHIANIYVSRLRRALGSKGKEFVTTVFGVIKLID